MTTSPPSPTTQPTTTAPDNHEHALSREPAFTHDRTPPHQPTPTDERASAGSARTRAGEVDAERLARAGLVRVVEPGDPAAATAFDGMEAVELWEALHEKRPMFERWSARVAEAQPEVDLERAAAAGARFVIPGDDEWPEQVEVLADAGLQGRRGGVPFGLWVRGPAQLRETLAKSVAVVGARACSAYGENAASELSAGLADEGVTVVSGGAYGIDAAAHRGALASGGPTVAVLACGVDVSYPKSNTALFDRIAERGLLISELPPRCSPTKLRFLARNRLIAATTLGTVVVEAAVRSGALNSAGWAEQCGRQVLAVPGPITSRMSEGVHLLIRERNAALATNVADILEAISPIGTHTTPYRHAPATITDHLDHDLSRTLDAVPVLRPVPALRIATTAGLDLDTTQECLETLAESNLVEYTETGWRLSPTHRQSL
jgi:DNA processing protein